MLAAASALLALAAAGRAPAQSADVNFPTPVFTNEVAARIAPRDLGDPRRTRHFYTFRGTEGDVSVTLEASELIGDVDVFTATTLRPLIKFSLFGDAARVTKSFYVRSEETLVLRVEARASGDSAGSYKLTFGGSFAPAPAGLADAPEPKTPTLADATRGGGTRRVTSTGARIEEPRPEPTPAPAETAAAPRPTPERPAPRTTRNTARGNRTTRPSTARARGTTPAARPNTAGSESAESKPEANTESGATAGPKAEAEKPTATAATRPAPRRRNTRGARARASSRDGAAADAQPSGGAEPAAAAPASAAPQQRLVIITKSGELLQRDMSTVRRVTVENNQLVVTTMDGKVIRRPMTDILRMSIEQ